MNIFESQVSLQPDFVIDLYSFLILWKAVSPVSAACRSTPERYEAPSVFCATRAKQVPLSEDLAYTLVLGVAIV